MTPLDASFFLPFLPLSALVLPIALQAVAPPTSARVVRLDDAVRTSLKHQPLVLQSRGSTEAAVGRSEQARSGLLPQITATAGYQKIHGTTTSGTGAAGGAIGTVGSTSSTRDFFSLGVSGSQLLWDFGQTPERLRAANRSVDAFKASEHTTELQVLLNVRRAFFTARAQKALIGVAEETLNNEQRHLQQIQGFVAVGTHPEIDLVQERTTLANDRVALIGAQNGYAIAKAQLNQAMGIIGDTSYDVADEGLGAIDGEDGAEERLVEAALATRPELVAYMKQQEASELTIKSLKGAYGPTLAAVGGTSLTGASLDSLGPNWNVGAALTWPIFQGGLTNGQVHEAQGNLDVVRAQLEEEKLQVRFDVQQAALTVRAAKASIEAANEALTSARTQLRLAEGRYQAGVGSIIELGDAQVTATNAAAQVVQADFNLASARAQLLTALGRP